MIEMNWFLPTGGDSRDVLPDETSVNRSLVIITSRKLLAHVKT